MRKSIAAGTSLKLALAAIAIVLLACCGVFAQEAADEAAPEKFPLLFPPLSHVEFNDPQATWMKTALVPIVDIALRPKVVVTSAYPATAKVKEVTARFTLNGGAIWEEVALLPSYTDPGVWEVRIQLPEWRKTLPGEDKIPEEELKTIKSKRVLGAKPGKSTASSTIKVAKAKPIDSAPPETGNSANLKKSPPKNKITYYDESPPPAETGTDKTANWLDSATAVICFRAVDSLGNTTVELTHQVIPAAETDVDFTNVMADKLDTGDKTDVSPVEAYRDILGADAAWLREFIYVRTLSAGAAFEQDLRDDKPSFIGLRLTPLDMPAVSEQAGRGLYSFIFINPQTIKWPDKSMFSESPFTLDINSDYFAKLANAVKKPDAELPLEVQEFMVSAENRQFDPTLDIFTKEDRDPKDFQTQTLLNRMYWRAGSNSITGYSRGDGFAFSLFSGYLENKGDFAMKVDDVSPYATVFLRHNVMSIKKSEIEQDSSGTEIMPRIMPYMLPPGAVGGQ